MVAPETKIFHWGILHTMDANSFVWCTLMSQTLYSIISTREFRHWSVMHSIQIILEHQVLLNCLYFAALSNKENGFTMFFLLQSLTPRWQGQHRVWLPDDKANTESDSKMTRPTRSLTPRWQGQHIVWLPDDMPNTESDFEASCPFDRLNKIKNCFQKYIYLCVRGPQMVLTDENNGVDLHLL